MPLGKKRRICSSQETEARVAVGRGEGGMPSLTISAAAAWPCLVAWVLVSNVNRTINSA